MKRIVPILLCMAMVLCMFPVTAFAVRPVSVAAAQPAEPQEALAQPENTRGSKDKGVEVIDLTLYHSIIVDGHPSISDEELEEWRAFSSTMSRLINTGRVICESEDNPYEYTPASYDLDCDGNIDMLEELSHAEYTELVYTASPDTNLSGTFMLELTAADKAALESSSSTTAYYSTLVFRFPDRANPFVDVYVTDYYYNAVLWAYYHKPAQVTAGTDATHFSPADTVTRGQAVTFLWNAAGRPDPAKTMNPFKDNKSGKYYYNAVLWAYYNDPQITNGTSTTTFSPNKTCTRAQIITFLWNALGRPSPTISNPYSDLTSSKYYYKAALWAYQNRIEKGSGGKFSADTKCTRAAIVAYLYRYYTGKDLAT